MDNQGTRPNLFQSLIDHTNGPNNLSQPWIGVYEDQDSGQSDYQSMEVDETGCDMGMYSMMHSPLDMTTILNTMNPQSASSPPTM